MLLKIKEVVSNAFIENHYAFSSGYEQVINMVENLGLISNTEAMYGMNKLLFANKKILALKFDSHSVYETLGGNIILDFANNHAVDQIQLDLINQSNDELKHGRMLASLIKYTGFNQEEISKASSSQADEQIPEFENDVKKFMCFIHAAEVRTLVMLKQYIHIINNSNDDQLKNMLPILSFIEKDEKNHAAYTGNYIGKWIDEDETYADTLLTCFSYTNRESMQEIAHMACALSKSYSE